MTTDLNYKMWSRLTSRKWVMCLLALAIAIGSRAIGWTDTASFVDMFKFSVGGYLAINLTDSLISAVKESVVVKLEKKDAS